MENELRYLQNVLGIRWVPKTASLRVESEVSNSPGEVQFPTKKGPLNLDNRGNEIPHHQASLKNEALRNVYDQACQSKHCQLCHTRTNFVFGAGTADARLMFVGEAPGEAEDLQGIPFVGAAGQLLTKMISAMGLSRDEVYIANILKCRPPGNRNPEPEEVKGCWPYLEQQIQIVKPEIIVALGKFAAQSLLGTEDKISALRGKIFSALGTKVLATYHPAYLLRNPQSKREVWADLQVVMKFLELEGPKSSRP